MSMEKQPKLSAKDQWHVFRRLLGYAIPHKKSITIALIPTHFDNYGQHCRASHYPTLHR